MKRFLLVLAALFVVVALSAHAEAVVLFPRLALQRQPVVVQRQAFVVQQPLVLRQRFVAPLVAPLFVQPSVVVPQAIVVPQVQQFQFRQSFSSPGCGSLLIR